GEPVEHELMAGTDAHHRRVVSQCTEAAAPENELRKLIRLTVHEQLVVGQSKASQSGRPFLVVPLRGVRQLAELPVARDGETAALELVRQRQRSDDMPSWDPGAEEFRVVACPTDICVAAENERVREADERLVWAARQKLGFDHPRVRMWFLVCPPGRSDRL